MLVVATGTQTFMPTARACTSLEASRLLFALFILKKATYPLVKTRHTKSIASELIASYCLVILFGYCFFPLAELPSRGTVAVLSAHLRLTDRLQRRLVEFMVLVASRHMTNADLAPVIR